MKRVFMIVCDSLGIGEMPDAWKWADEGSDTLGAIRQSPLFHCPNLGSLGLFRIDGVERMPNDAPPIGAYGRLTEISAGKDTTTGHWELAGLISWAPFPTYPNGFPTEVMNAFEKAIGRGTLCNKPYSGTEVIKAYGEEHIKTGKPIVYTSADSVFQIAAHEDVIPTETLYEYCRIARKILTGEHAVGRVIARPFAGTYPFYRTAARHDFSLLPPEQTMLDILKKNGLDVISIGKIYDIFAGKGITEKHLTTDNNDGMRVLSEMIKKEFNGICFANLVDFDMKYGHRNDANGYAKALSEFDAWLPTFMKEMKEEDVLIITADHGCDPSTPSTDHSREYVPVLLYGKTICPKNLYTRESFADVSATILDYFGVEKENTAGESFLPTVRDI